MHLHSMYTNKKKTAKIFTYLTNNSESTLWFLDFGDHKRRVQVRPKRFLALRTKTVIDFFALSLGERF